MSPARMQHKHKNNGIETNEWKVGRKLAIIDVETTLAGMILDVEATLTGLILGSPQGLPRHHQSDIHLKLTKKFGLHWG
jgi:hypothetical protein